MRRLMHSQVRSAGRAEELSTPSGAEAVADYIFFSFGKGRLYSATECLYRLDFLITVAAIYSARK
jgi:hypothetical protein